MIVTGFYVRFQMIGKAITNLLAHIPYLIAMNRGRNAGILLGFLSAVGFDGSHLLSFVLLYHVAIALAVAHRCKGRETALACAGLQSVVLSVAAGIAGRHVGHHRTVGILGNDVDYTSQSVAVIQRGSRATNNFDAFYIIDVKAREVDVMVSTFARYAFAIKQKQDVFAPHTLITDFLGLAH